MEARLAASASSAGFRDRSGNRKHLFRACPPRHDGGNVLGFQFDDFIEVSAIVPCAVFSNTEPLVPKRPPWVAFGRPFDVFECNVVGAQ